MMEMLLTGESLSATDAVNFGLVNKCVKHEFLKKTTLDMASLIASKPKSTVRIGKQAFYNQIELPTNKAYEYTSKVMSLNMMEKDANEGIEAFVNKRDPHWFS